MEALVGLIVAVVLVIFVMFFVIGVFHYVGQVLWVSILAWGIAPFVCLGVFLFLRFMIDSWHDRSLANLAFSQKELQWQRKPRGSGGSELTPVLAVLGGLATLVIILNSRYALGGFDGVHWWRSLQSPERVPVSPTVTYAFAYVFALPLHGVAEYFLLKLVGDVDFSRSRMIHRSMNRHLKHREALIGTLKKLDTVSKDVSVRMDCNFRAPLAQYANRNKMKLSRHPGRLDKRFRKTLDDASLLLERLGATGKLLRKAEEEFMETARVVNLCGSVSMITQLERDYEGIVSQELRSLISRREWREFEEVVEELLSDMSRLRAQAEAYTTGAEETGEQRTTEEMNERRALETLGLPDSASNEEVQKVYRLLAKAWHPDRKESGATARMIEINAAYEYLKRIRGI